MLYTNLKTAFPFFKTTELTAQCQLWNDNAWRVWQHLMPEYLTSFQIKRTENVGHAIATFTLKSEFGSTIQSLDVNKIDVYNCTTFDYLVFDSTSNKIYVQDGYYYLEVSDGHTTWRSVRFQCSGHSVPVP